MTKPVFAPLTITLTPDEIEECEIAARREVDYYRNNGNRRTAMPWTSDQFTDDELRLWLASPDGSRPTDRHEDL